MSMTFRSFYFFNPIYGPFLHVWAIAFFCKAVSGFWSESCAFRPLTFTTIDIDIIKLIFSLLLSLNKNTWHYMFYQFKFQYILHDKNSHAFFLRGDFPFLFFDNIISIFSKLSSKIFPPHPDFSPQKTVVNNNFWEWQMTKCQWLCRPLIRYLAWVLGIVGLGYSKAST